MVAEKKRSGLDIAIELTIRIYESLSPATDKDLLQKLADSIFDDQLKAYTNYNRQQRHSARKLLKQAMKKREVK